jgi:hypothetical protein
LRDTRKPIEIKNYTPEDSKHPGSGTIESPLGDEFENHRKQININYTWNYYALLVEYSSNQMTSLAEREPLGRIPIGSGRIPW